MHPGDPVPVRHYVSKNDAKGNEANAWPLKWLELQKVTVALGHNFRGSHHREPGVDLSILSKGDHEKWGFSGIFNKIHTLKHLTILSSQFDNIVKSVFGGMVLLSFPDYTS